MKDSLIPRPQKCKSRSGTFKADASTRILLPGGGEGRAGLLLAAETVQAAILEQQGTHIDLGAAFGDGAQPSRAIEWRIDKSAPSHPEGYKLSVRPDTIIASARKPQGLRHAAATLCQLARLGAKRGMPCVEIEDWPNQDVRGYMLDISRGKVPTLQTLFGIVDGLVGLKYNSLQLYCEHTFHYRRHPEIGAQHSPMTAEEVLKLDDYCHRRGVELVPNLQSFGHQHHILKLPRYKHLAESESRGGWCLSPARPGTYKLLADLYAEYLPLFRSKRLNISCDETYDLGRGLSKRRADRIGVGRVYLEHILKLRKLAARFGKGIMMWGDIVQNHPGIVPDIPKDIVMLDWFYDTPSASARRQRSARNRLFRDAGLETINCPGTNTWVTLACRTEMARANIRWFTELGRKNGAAGMLLTDWGDNGHMNLQGFSQYPIALGADSAWHGGAKDSPKFDRAFSKIFYGDGAGQVARLVRSLSRIESICRVPGVRFSGPRDFLLGDQSPRRMQAADPEKRPSAAAARPQDLERGLAESEAARDKAAALLSQAKCGTLDLEEHLYAAQTLCHGYRRARLARAIAGLTPLPKGTRAKAECSRLAEEVRVLSEDLKRLWLERSKPSDLADNLSRLRRTRLAYPHWKKQA